MTGELAAVNRALSKDFLGCMFVFGEPISFTTGFIFIFTDLHTPDRLVYQIYPVTSNRVTFKIKAPKDAHIILLPAPYESQPCYEVSKHCLVFHSDITIHYQSCL